MIITKEETEYYHNIYMQGISTLKLGKMFNLSPDTLRENFHKYGLYVRSNKENSRRFFADFNYFERIDTAEKAYWLGFIYADGYVSSANGKRFGMSLSTKDIDHLEKLNRCLKSTYPINTYTVNHGYKIGSEYCRLIISSDKLYDDLVNQGVYEHKTNIIQKPNIERQFYAPFILGLFDGDGSIFLNHSKYPFYSINFMGTIDIIEFIQDYFIEEELVSSLNKPYQKREGQSVYALRYGGNVIVEKIMTHLYQTVDTDLPLKRKYELYLKCKQRKFD